MAIQLVDRIVVDPHSVDDAFYAELLQHFSEDEIIELVCASGLLSWAGTLNTTVRLATGSQSAYGDAVSYATARR